MRWEGTIRGTFVEDFDVEADTEDEAIKKAEDECKAAIHVIGADCEHVEVDTIYPDEEEG